MTGESQPVVIYKQRPYLPPTLTSVGLGPIWYTEPRKEHFRNINEEKRVDLYPDSNLSCTEE